MDKYVRECSDFEKRLEGDGWCFKRDMSSSWMTFPCDSVKLICSEVKDIVLEVFYKYYRDAGNRFSGDLSDLVCRRSGDLMVLENLPCLYDMDRYETYGESREKDFERYFLLSEVAKRLVRI